MDGLSFSSWIILILGFVICFGGAFYCLLIVWGKRPERIFEVFGLSEIGESSLISAAEDVLYLPFEYMEQGHKEQGVVFGVVLILLTIGWGLGAFESEEEAIYTDIDYDVELKEGALDPINGHSEQNSEQQRDVEVDEAAIANITFTLIWDDEDANAPGYVNGPDEFRLEVATPWGANDTTPMTENDGNGHGEISLTFMTPGEYPDTGSAGTYLVTIEMGDAEDQSLGGQGSGINFVDDGNDWTLTIEYDYYEEGFIDE